jgi:predicted permease
MTFSYDVPSGRSTRDQQLAFDRLLLERVRQVPGVETAAHAMPAPFSGNMVSDELVAELGVRQTLRASWSAVSAGYFGTIGLPLADGRGFTDQDVATHAPVAIINETLAEQLAPDGHVLGRRFRLGGADTPWRSVVGVARDSKHDMLTEDPRPFVYLPWGQTPPWRISVLVRLTGEPAAIIPLVSAAVRQLDATLPLYRVSTMHDQIGRTMDVHQAASSFLALFGGLALLLAAVGIYGVTAHGVTLRTREIGIRMSFGAETAQVKRMFVGEGLRLSAVGIAIGLAISAAAADLLASFLFGLGATDPVTFAGVAALLCSVAMVASYLPARRAAGIDPLRALRHD